MAKRGRQGDGGGRPRIRLTEAQVAEVETLGALLSIEQMADYFGIGRTTMFELMDRQPEVSERYKAGKSKAIATVARGLLMQARDGNVSAATFYLKTQAGWRETTHVEMTGKDSGPIQHEDVTRDADAFARRLLGLAARAAGKGNGEADA